VISAVGCQGLRDLVFPFPADRRRRVGPVHQNPYSPRVQRLRACAIRTSCAPGSTERSRRPGHAEHVVGAAALGDDLSASVPARLTLSQRPVTQAPVVALAVQMLPRTVLSAPLPS